MPSSDYSPFSVRAKTRQVVDHHYDDQRPGKPLYLVIPGGPWSIFLGGLGAPRQMVTREVVRELPAEPQAPQPAQCPYCSTRYLPTQTDLACPNCGAPAPTEAMSAGSNV